MFISIDLDPEVISYLDSVCGGASGRSNYIQNLITAYAQNQPVQAYPEPEPSYNNTQRLNRYQKGFQQIEAPIKHRASYGSVRT